MVAAKRRGAYTPRATQPAVLRPWHGDEDDPEEVVTPSFCRDGIQDSAGSGATEVLAA